MKRSTPTLAIGALATLVVAWLIGTNHPERNTALLLIVLGSIVLAIAFSVQTPGDERWISWTIIGAYAAKLIGSWVRYYTVVEIYGTGDALAYHAAGLAHAADWRAFELPVVIGRSAGTRFVEVATSLLYAVNIPTLLGGFFLFATIAFIGQLLFYFAYRRTVGQGLGLYAALIFFAPSLLFWPASVGKDSLMVLGIGGFAYGVARLTGGKWLTGIPLMVAGLALAGVIRPHVGAMLVAASAITVALWRSSLGGRQLVRIVLTVALAASVFFVITQAQERLGFAIGVEEMQDFAGDVVTQTGQGGSAVSQEPLTSPLGLPGAAIHVLFRPLIHEADSLQTLVSAVEGTAMLVATLVVSPAIIRGLGTLRKQPYISFALFYNIFFVVAFSAIANLGIMARQRVQVLPLFFAVVVGLGYRSRSSRENDVVDATEREEAMTQLTDEVATA